MFVLAQSMAVAMHLIGFCESLLDMIIEVLIQETILENILFLKKDSIFLDVICSYQNEKYLEKAIFYIPKLLQCPPLNWITDNRIIRLM
jgi:hypothetical protein